MIPRVSLCYLLAPVPGIIVSNIAQGVAGLTVAFRTKDIKLKQIATAGGMPA